MDFALLVDWVEGKLEPEESQQVADALMDVNEETQADVRISRWQAASGEIQFAVPPASVREVLTQRFDQFAKRKQQ